MPRSRFEAIIGDRAIDLSLDDTEVTYDDESLSYSLERVGAGSYSLIVGQRSASVLVESIGPKQYRITVDGHSRTVRLKDEQDLLLEELGLEEMAAAGEEEIRAPMPGLVLEVRVTPGQMVEEDDGLVVVEAMKMENELRSPTAGEIKTVHVAAGDTVDKDQLLIELEQSSA